MSKGAMVAIVGAALGLVSVFLPWYNFELLGIAVDFKPWGTSTAWVLIVLAVLGIVFAMQGSKKGSKGMYVGALVMGFLFLGVVAMNDPSRSGFDMVEKFYGFYVSFVAGLVMLVGGIMGVATKKK